MTDHSDYIEKNEQTLNIPAHTTARYRMCKKLIGDLFFARLALALSVLINFTLIWAYRL